jgi:hypothetical protein
MSDASIVSRGVDTLVVNAYHTDSNGKPVKRELDGELYKRLNEWKKEAQGMHEECPTALSFNGATLHMQPNGAGQGQWPWMLKTRDITLYISGGNWNGIASIRFNSDYLWSCRGVLDALQQAQMLLDGFFDDGMFLQLSQVDLCVDVANWQDIDQLDRFENFVTRAKKRTAYAEADWGYDGQVQEYSYGKQQTGFTFGRGKRGNSPVSCRIYDKTREILHSGKTWVPDLWGVHGWSGEGDVWRVEISFKREALHEIFREDTKEWGFENAYQLPDILSLLWAYAVGQVGGGPDGLPNGWLRCAVSNGDTNRSRWPTHPVWKVVQGAFLQSIETPEQFGRIIRKQHEQRNIHKGLEAVMGYLTSIAAWKGGELAEEGVDLSVVLHWLAIDGEKYLDRVGRDFSAEIQRKRVRLGLQQAR